MSKAFTKESDGADDDDLPEDTGGLPAGAKNYMTPQGFARMREELDALMRKERPEVVKVVTWANAKGDERTIKIVGVDEVELDKGHVSWISPIAKALLRAEEGDVVKMRTPHGIEDIEIVKVTYR